MQENANELEFLLNPEQIIAKKKDSLIFRLGFAQAKISVWLVEISCLTKMRNDLNINLKLKLNPLSIMKKKIGLCVHLSFGYVPIHNNIHRAK